MTETSHFSGSSNSVVVERYDILCASENCCNWDEPLLRNRVHQIWIDLRLQSPEPQERTVPAQFWNKVLWSDCLEVTAVLPNC